MDSITPCSDRSTRLARDEFPHPTGAIKSSKGSITYWPGRNIIPSRGESNLSPARSFKVTRDYTSILSHRSFSFAWNIFFTNNSRGCP
jgi:hypothetical protein